MAVGYNYGIEWASGTAADLIEGDDLNDGRGRRRRALIMAVSSTMKIQAGQLKIK
jgi:hypothetical protein